MSTATCQPVAPTDADLRRVKLLSLGDVAALLGVSRQTAWRWRRRRVLPLPVLFLPGGAPRVPLPALECWLADVDAEERRAGAC